jgi:hypothetical protein
MEDQNQHSDADQPIQEYKPVVIQPQHISPVPPDKLQLTSQEAEALLTVNNLDVNKKASGNSKWLLIVMVVTALVIIGAVLFSTLGSKSPKGSSSPDISLPDSKGNPLNGNNINQQIKYCSNLINASTVC